MGSRFVWFLLGVATGVTAVAVLKHVEKEKESEDFEAVADSLQKRFENLEQQLGTAN